MEPAAMPVQSVIQFRVRYSETDQMGTFANPRALEWFECGRTEWLRQAGLNYAQAEQRGLFLPVVEANVRYTGRAKYDDLLTVTTTATMAGKVRLRFEVKIVQADTGAGVAKGFTIHAFTDTSGKPIRPPEWFVEKMGAADQSRFQQDGRP
jgi:acyl-CoA thioester hydrolase